MQVKLPIGMRYKRQTVRKLKLVSKVFGYLPEKNLVQNILRGFILVFAQSVVACNAMT